MQSIIIEARFQNSREWGIRNRLGDLNYLYRDKKISLETALMKAQLFVVRWVAVEPYTDFRVTVE